MSFMPPPMPPPGLTPEDEEAMKKSKESTDQKESDTTDIDIEQSEEDKISEATRQKAEGLEAFKKQELKVASEEWANALLTLRGTVTMEAVDMKQSLHANLALCYLKRENYADCIEQCTEVLRMDSKNVKALYRRSKAYLATGNGTDAKADLLTLVHLEPKTAEYRRMYDEAVHKAQVQKDEAKKNFSNLFSKPGLYDDREVMRKKKEEEDKLINERKQKEFEDEMARRATAGEDLVDFEAWEKERNGAEQKRMDEHRKPKASPSKTTTAKKDESSDDYTEEEKKILADTKARGYCYFKNSELTPEEREMKKKVNVNAPKQISGQTQEERPWTPDQAGIGSGLSSWNSAGTSYEEKDQTKWAKDCLKTLLLDVQNIDVSCGVLSFQSIAEFTGEANAAVVRGTNRYFYDFDVKVKFTFEPSMEEGASASSGELHFQPTNVTASDDPDCPDWYSEATVVWRSKHVTTEVAQKIAAKAKEMVLCLVKGFEDSFGQLIAAKK